MVPTEFDPCYWRERMNLTLLIVNFCDTVLILLKNLLGILLGIKKGLEGH